jgi:hypothetical protein
MLNLFHTRKLARYLHNPIHDQGRSNQYTIVRDGLDVLDLDHLCIHADFFDGLLRSLRELIALCSTHA